MVVTQVLVFFLFFFWFFLFSCGFVKRFSHEMNSRLCITWIWLWWCGEAQHGMPGMQIEFEFVVNKNQISKKCPAERWQRKTKIRIDAANCENLNKPPEKFKLDSKLVQWFWVDHCVRHSADAMALATFRCLSYRFSFSRKIVQVETRHPAL